MHNLPNERSVVDNRVFLLGLDKLYREAMKPHERGELLSCARRVAEVLQVAPADVPVEGYYTEDEQLAEYFQLVRALQETPEGRTSEVATLKEFQRLRSVTSAPLYGQPQQRGRLLAVGKNALSQALLETRPEWNVARLTEVASAKAHEMDDFSLVGLAARLRDPVVLAALGETVVLHAYFVTLGLEPRREYLWHVDDDLAAQARRFIAVFEHLFGEKLPPPDPMQAELYWTAYADNQIIGRCVRLGHDLSEPRRHYHWAIRPGSGELTVHEFWDTEVWTTARYRERLGGDLDSVRATPDIVRVRSWSKITEWIKSSRSRW